MGFGGGDNSDAIRQQAEEERKRYEAQIKAQREAALLEGSKSADNIAKVEVGSQTDYSFDGTSTALKKKRITNSSASTSLGIR